MPIRPVHTATGENNDEALRQAAILARISDGVNVVSAQDGRIVYNNPAFESMFGYAPGELVGQSTEMLNAPEGGVPEATTQAIIATLQKTGRWDGELLSRRKDGTTFWTYTTITSHDLPGWGAVWMGVQHDISERKRAEAVIAQRQALLDSIMVNTDVMLVYLDSLFNFVWVNRSYADTCHMRPEEMVGKNHFELYPDEENEAIFRQVRDTGAAVFFKDKPFEFPDQPERGTTYWDWSLSPNLTNGKVVGLVFSLRETTSFVLTSRALNDKHALFAAVFKHSPAGKLILHMDSGAIVEVNPAFEASSGYGRDELIGHTPKELNLWYNPADRIHAMTSFDHADSQGESEVEFVHKSGEIRTALLRINPVGLNGERCCVVMLIDITERKQAEAALVERDNLLRMITDHAADGIFVLDREHRQHYINPAAVEVVRQAGAHPDWDAETIVGKTALDLFGDTPTGRLFIENDERVMQSGKAHSFEDTVPTPSGTRTLLTIRSPYFDDQGRVIGMVGTTRDITERKQAETERLTNLERQRDTLIREVHHRIKNHLQGIVGLLKNRIKDRPDIAAPLSEAVAQVETIAQIYGLKGRNNMDQVRLGDVLRIAVENVIQDVPIEYTPPATGTPATLSPNEEVPAALIVNELVTNAAKYLDHDAPGRVLRIKMEIDAREARIEIRNAPAVLPQDFDFGQCIGCGTGLELVRALLAPQGMALDFHQEGNSVVTTLRLFPPVIALSPWRRGADDS